MYDNIKTVRNKIGWEVVNIIRLVRNRKKWPPVINAVMKFRAPYNVENFFNKYEISVSQEGMWPLQSVSWFILMSSLHKAPIPVAERSKVRVPTDQLLGLRVRIPPGAWMSLCCECCVLSGSGFCDRPIPRPEESYRLWCVSVCDLHTLKD